MKNLLAKVLLLGMTLASITLVVLLNTTTPTRAGAVGILAVFVLGYIVVVALLSFFMYVVAKIIVAGSRIITIRKPLEPISLKRAYYFSSVIGLAPIIVLSLQSVGSLGIYEIGLVALLILIGCVYVAKRTI